MHATKSNMDVVNLMAAMRDLKIEVTTCTRTSIAADFRRDDRIHRKIAIHDACGCRHVCVVSFMSSPTEALSVEKEGTTHTLESCPFQILQQALVHKEGSSRAESEKIVSLQDSTDFE